MQQDTRDLLLVVSFNRDESFYYTLVHQLLSLVIKDGVPQILEREHLGEPRFVNLEPLGR